MKPTIRRKSHWHVILAGVGDRQENFFEFENHYGLGEALEVFAAACRGTRSIDFARARRVFMDEHSLEALFLMK